MKRDLRILIVEDLATDAELEIRELKRAGILASNRVVDTEAAYREALLEFKPDVILSDFSMPHFDGMWALEIAREVVPTVPFIFVSGTIGEEYAIRALRNGATDYVLKNNLMRLPAAVERALQDSAERVARFKVENDLQVTRSRLDSIVSSLSDVVWSVTLSPYKVNFVSRSFEDVWGQPVAKLDQNPELWLEAIHADDRSSVDNKWREALLGKPFDVVYRITAPDGTVRWIHDRAKSIRDESGNVIRLDGTARDITELKNQEQRITRLNRVHAVFSGINSAIVHLNDRLELLEQACRIAVRQGKFELAWAGLHDADAMEVAPIAWVGLDTDQLKGHKSTVRPDLPQGQGYLGRAVREGKPVFCNDIEPGVGGSRLQDMRRRGYRSVGVLPLFTDKAVVAVLVLFAKEPDFFTEEEVKLLEELSANISFALGHIAGQHKLEKLSRIRTISSEINSLIVRVGDSNKLFEETCRVAVEHGGFGIAWIGIVDQLTKDIVPAACAGFDAESLMATSRNTAHPDKPQGHGIVGRSIREKRAVYSNDITVETSPGGARRLEAVRRGYRSLISLPLLLGDKVAGSLSLFAKEPNFFDNEEIAALTELAGNVSFALDRIKKGEALAESEKKLDSILSTLQEVVWSIDPRTGKLLYVNAAIRHLTRRPVSDFLARPRLWSQMVHPEDRERFSASIRTLLKEGVVSHEFRIRLIDGDERIVESSARVSRDAQGNAVRIDGTVSDITDRKRAEMALVKLNEELEDKVVARTADLERARRDAEEANSAKSMFLATMSHEIRTPMNGVIGMIDVLHQTSLRGDQVEMVELVRESAFSLLGIINDILDFSKIEAGKLEIECEAICIAEIVEGVGTLMNSMAQKKNVAITEFVDPQIPNQLIGDSLRLRQVLTNLVSNAVKFSSGHLRFGRTSVRALLVEHSENRALVEFQVADNGVGMDEQTKARLFTAFTQADASTTRRFGGTGLGLAISNHLVGLMNGEIGVQSTPGEGATFKVRLPFHLVPNLATESKTSPNVAGVSCIVIGDQRGIADDLARYLEHADARVERAPTMEQAKQLMAARTGLTIWIVDSGDERRSREQLRTCLPSQENQEVRLICVVIERGKRHRPRVVDSDLITIDGNALGRRQFLTVVAVAAGRASIEQDMEALSPTKVVPIAPSREEARKRGQLILIAEDNETNQKVILRQLALLGHTGDVTSDGLQALQQWRRGDYALVLTDLHMPAMDGYELTETIRAEETGEVRTPIVALTANVLKGEAEKCRAIGMDDYCSKPMPLADLRSILDKWLPRSKPSSVLTAAPDLGSRVLEVTKKPVDLDMLKLLVGEDSQIVCEFVDDYCRTASTIAADLRTACAEGRTAMAAAAAHKLKSSSRAVGATALGDLCEAIEEEGKTGEIDGLSVLMPRFEAELAAVLTYLEKSKLELGALKT